MTNKPDGRSIPVRQDVVMPEVARLYREVEAERDEWRERCERLSVEAGKLAVENDELRAQVERHVDNALLAASRIETLRAEVERLRAVIVAAADVVKDRDPDAAAALLRTLDRHMEC